MGLENLTPAELERFRAVNRRFGLPEDTVTDHTPDPSLNQQGGKLIFSSDPAASHYRPNLISVKNIDQLKQLAGIPDGHDGSHVAYPAPLSELVSTDVSSVDPAAIQSALRAYLAGNSAKLQSHVPIINAAYFPSNVASFSGADLTINTPVVVQGPQPVAWNYDTITIEQGGSLTILTDFILNVSQLISVGANNLITVTGEPLASPVSPSGAPGAQGQQGAQGTSGVCAPDTGTSGTPMMCVTRPGNGGSGGQGGAGGNASSGINGNPQPTATINAQTVTGNIIVQAGGGTGQNGGTGGPGGNGGSGGPAGTNCGPCPPANSGNQGPGGNGGNGGTAGNGGDGNVVSISYGSLSGSFLPQYIGGNPGQGGQGGVPGSGPGGSPGAPGNNGTPGAKATITIAQS